MKYRQVLIRTLVCLLATTQVLANESIRVSASYRLESFDEAVVKRYETLYGLKNNQVVAKIFLEPGKNNLVTYSRNQINRNLTIMFRNRISDDEHSACDFSLVLSNDSGLSENTIKIEILESMLSEIGKKSLILTVIDGPGVGCKIINAMLQI